MTSKSLSLSDVILQDLWVHIAALIAIAVGLLDLWLFHQLSKDTELIIAVGGFAGMGLKIANGTTAQLRQAALDTAFTAARTAQIAAAVVTPAPPAAAGPAAPVSADGLWTWNGSAWVPYISPPAAPATGG